MILSVAPCHSKEDRRMKISNIIDLGGGRHKVTLEDGTTFPLYKKEISKWDLKEGQVLFEKDFKEIKESILLKRAKKRALYLLEKTGRSESNLASKLKEGFYPEDIVENAVNYAKSFGYLDDENFARNLLESRMYKKSKQEIIATLKQKGLEQETIKDVFDKHYDEDSEKEAIKHHMDKKRIDLESITPKELNKFYSYLARKGFSFDSISSQIKKH